MRSSLRAAFGVTDAAYRPQAWREEGGRGGGGIASYDRPDAPWGQGRSFRVVRGA